VFFVARSLSTLPSPIAPSPVTTPCWHATLVTKSAGAARSEPSSRQAGVTIGFAIFAVLFQVERVTVAALTGFAASGVIDIAQHHSSQ
jgi:hypothetical protein